MTIGLIIVGDEILSGKRTDKHFSQVVSILAERGLTLGWAHYIGDDREAMTDLLRSTFATGDIVFSTGGIGATPDDHTRQAAAAALDRPLVPHPEAVALLRGRIAAYAAEKNLPADLAHPENQQRLRMAEFPAEAAIIPNPVNQIAGFGVHQHWFVPGFPAMARPMIAWVLDTHYRKLFPATAAVERALHIHDVPESAVAPWMEAIEGRYPGVRTFSLPSTTDEDQQYIELGVKGMSPAVDQAYEQLFAAAAGTGARVEAI